MTCVILFRCRLIWFYCCATSNRKYYVNLCHLSFWCGIRLRWHVRLFSQKLVSLEACQSCLTRPPSWASQYLDYNHKYMISFHSGYCGRLLFITNLYLTKYLRWIKIYLGNFLEILFGAPRIFKNLIKRSLVCLNVTYSFSFRVFEMRILTAAM